MAFAALPPVPAITVTHGTDAPDPKNFVMHETHGLIMGMTITRMENGDINIWLEHDPKKYVWDGCSEMFQYHLELELTCVQDADTVFTPEEAKAVKDALKTELKLVTCHVCDHLCQ